MPEPVASAVDALRRSLGVPEPFRIPAHLTLVPPRWLEVADLPRARELLRGVAEATPPFEVTLGPVTSFSPECPTLHLAAQSEHGELAGLREALNTGVLAGEDPWEFVPHVTLALPFEESRVTAASELLGGAHWSFRATGLHLLELTAGEAASTWSAVIEERFAARRRMVLEDGVELVVCEHGVLEPSRSSFAASVGFPADRWRPGSVYVSLEDDAGEVVALAHGRGGPIAELVGVMVAPAWRERGLGGMVLEAWLSMVRREGADLVVSQPTSSSSRSWLGDQGFIDAGWPWMRAR